MARAKSNSDADTSGSGAAEHRQHGVDAHTVHDAQFDSRSARVSDFVKDTGTDERYQLETADRSSMWAANNKRTYDLHQTMDTDGLMDKRRQQSKLDSMEIAEREQRLKHQAKMDAMEVQAAEQTRRHYEDMHTARFLAGMGFTADTVQEAFADMVADKVCVKLNNNK